MLLISQETKNRAASDSDSDAENTKFSPPKLSDTYDNTLSPGPDSYTQSKRAGAVNKADLDFGSDDDDPGEMVELMRNFIAPSNGGRVNKAQSYKGSSSNTSSSIKYGAGGIRGIQHQRMQGDRDDDSVNTSISTYSMNTTNSAVSAANASKLMHIKPGQAIRVKAPNKKSRSSSVNNNINGSIG